LHLLILIEYLLISEKKVVIIYHLEIWKNINITFIDIILSLNFIIIKMSLLKLIYIFFFKDSISVYKIWKKSNVHTMHINFFFYAYIKKVCIKLCISKSHVHMCILCTWILYIVQYSMDEPSGQNTITCSYFSNVIINRKDRTCHRLKIYDY